MSGIDSIEKSELSAQEADKLLKEYEIYISTYWEWMKTEGEYFVDSELLMNEVQECSELSSIVETLAPKKKLF